MDNRIYFAQKDAKDVAAICLEKSRTFFRVLESNSFIEKINKMWKFYHGIFNNNASSHQMNFTGEQGELVSLPVNHFRNLAQHIYNMITANRPVMEARAVNTDYKSLSQTYVANGILDYYMREKRLEDCLKKAVEMSIVCGAAFVKLDWNATSGEIYDIDPDTDEPIYEGDIEFSILNPLDVVVDGTKETWSNDWIIVRTYQNRYNLAAKYPELREKLLSLPTKNNESIHRLSIWSNDDTDDIPVYEFYHRRSEALPDGRYILFASPECILLDTRLPYREIPIYRIAPSDILGTPYGYTPMFDIFPIQEGINGLYSIIMTNQNAFGVQNVFVPRGADITVSSLAGGLNIIESTARPESLNLTQTPAEIFRFLDMLIQAAETISGINSVARGNPEASLKSGAALALVQSMAIQYISGLQQSYIKLVEDVGTGIINILKDFATTPKIVALVGKNNRTELREFIGEDIKAINRVIVDVGNPLSRTIAGRVQMAEQMLNMGLIKTPQQYFQVMNTGKLDTVYEGEISELLNIKKENEDMMNGKPPIALSIDDHRMHIVEHKTILADPDLRRNDEIVRIVTQHILEHIDLLRTTDPDLLMLLGQQPLQPPPPMGNPQEGLPPMPNNVQTSSKEGISEVIATNAGNNQIQSVDGSTMLPKMPTPPPPFENLPTNPEDLVF